MPGSWEGQKEMNICEKHQAVSYPKSTELEVWGSVGSEVSVQWMIRLHLSSVGPKQHTHCL